MLKATNHVVVVEDFERIFKLNDLALKYTSLDKEAEGNILGRPVPCGNIVLYPLTLGSAKWIEDCVMEWFPKSPVYANLAMAYALSRSNKPGELWELKNKREAKKAILRFWRKCGCRMKQLEAALVGMFPDVDSADEDDVNANYGPLIAMLCKEYGRDPDYWMWDASYDMVMALIKSRECQAKAEWNALKSSAKGSDMPAMPGSMLARFKAYKDFRAKIEHEWSL